MNNKIKVVKLTLNGFRGARKKVYLDCDKKLNSIVLFGNNGDGKTSFSDAIEWFFTDKIQYLQREGCGKEDYFNKYIPEECDAYVELNFNDSKFDSQKILRRKKTSSFSNGEKDFSGFIRDSSKEQIILRHHTMREFIDKTKAQKLEKLEEIIGFGIVNEVRDNLLKATNSLSKDTRYMALIGQLAERKTDITGILAKDVFQESDIITFTDKKAKECDKTLSIKNIIDLNNTVEKLNKQLANSDHGKQMLAIDEISNKTNGLLGLKATTDEINDLVLSHNALAKERKTIEASAREKIYSAAIEALENKSVKPGECPVCKKPVNTDELLISLKNEMVGIGEVLKKRKAIVQKVKMLQTKMLTHHSNFDRLLALKKENEPFFSTGLKETIENTKNQLPAQDGALGKILLSTDAISLPSIKDLIGIKEKIEKEQFSILAMKKALEATDEEKKFYQNVTAINGLSKNYIRYQELRSLIQKFSNQISSMKKISESFEKMEAESIRNVLTIISKDVNEYFIFLHPDDQIEGIELITTEERGIEFKLKRHGVEITPPTKILSEAHLNSLGICLFLASAKYFNKVNGFIILDDVITSFDIGHRRLLSRLFIAKFPDTQFFLLTHDGLWFEMLKTDLSGNNWIFKELVKWNKEDGIDTKDSPKDLRARINENLKENDEKGAATKCRTLIEEVLKEKCEDLGVKGLEFRMGEYNDRRDPSELIGALTTYINDNRALSEKESKEIFKHLRASQLITNIGAHHRDLESTKLHRGDVELALKDIDEFESLFICPKCNTEPKKKYSPPFSKLKNCKCGEFKI